MYFDSLILKFTNDFNQNLNVILKRKQIVPIRRSFRIKKILYDRKTFIAFNSLKNIFWQTWIQPNLMMCSYGFTVKIF